MLLIPLGLHARMGSENNSHYCNAHMKAWSVVPNINYQLQNKGKTKEINWIIKSKKLPRLGGGMVGL